MNGQPAGLLAGKVALITGGSRGIGAAIAAAFHRDGAKVAICGRKQETLDAVAASIGAGVLPCAAHVGRADDLKALVARVEEQLGPIDILVNNAATNVAQGPCLSLDEGAFDKMVEVNLKSTFRLTQLIAPGMCDRGRGSILNIASVAGLKPQFESLLYSMTKAALIMMTKSYAQELGPKGVRVNAIAPGLIQTKLSEFFWKDEERRRIFFKDQPIQHVGQPEEIAELAVLLAGDRASYVTGEVVVADGGFLLT
ncbi:MAG: SDR family oxidoreductase [Acidobacteria bacterium]|nr:SDR family oxidoreductase [Acidobacteriota bacterium]